jgi:hypothetical protein
MLRRARSIRSEIHDPPVTHANRTRTLVEFFPEGPPGDWMTPARICPITVFIAGNVHH